MEIIKNLFKNNSFVYFAKNWKKANWSIGTTLVQEPGRTPS